MISGYDLKTDSVDYPTLDSLVFTYPKTVITQKETIYQPIPQKQGFKLKLRPAITAGYDPINRQWGIMAGIALTF